MEYLDYAMFFLVGYAVGKSPFVIQFLKVRNENMALKRDITILKEHLSNTGRGKIVKK